MTDHKTDCARVQCRNCLDADVIEYHGILSVFRLHGYHPKFDERTGNLPAEMLVMRQHDRQHFSFPACCHGWQLGNPRPQGEYTCCTCRTPTARGDTTRQFLMPYLVEQFYHLFAKMGGHAGVTRDQIAVQLRTEKDRAA